ncbi:ShlB/FhaC/HecB family hemolysin secretion/activation protein [Comamonas sp. 17RB]|uniref:ShlB/FhaC/HecB family hemolysin secretion/activation protein n=1 Tax=Comamonas sp. 17RB TaxID=3047025 RepID=UPI0024B6D217|nr:ShlB/FhaC/HecB family hemolysin secretion/activation protein [Comamonas sp. 17RB]MDI9854618.1 ShlB/FhaC/HecB family hemolysin secretion/activation protein [Comamonas sp. 17RB]
MQVLRFTQRGMVITAAMLCMHTYAQTSSELQQATQDAQRQQQLQAQRLQEQLARDRLSASPPAQISITQPESSSKDNGACRDIQTVHVDGASLFSPADLDRITQPYLQRCLGVGHIEALLSDITRAYVQKGWVGVRAYLPQQDLSEGRLKILVVEGKLSKIRVEDGGKNSISVGTIAPGLEGAPLNIRDLEQALDQANRLASNNATLEMLPGNTPGDSIVVLHNKPTFPLHALVSLDNQGSESTGESQAGVTVSIDNILGFNDFVSYTKRRTFPLGDKQRLSESDSMTYIIPFGYTTLSINGSVSRYASSFSTASGTRLKNSGDTDSYSIRLDHVLSRDATTRWNLYSNLTAKESKSYLEDTLLEAASRKMSVLDVGGSVNTVVAGGFLYLDLGVSQGLRSFGALRDADGLTASDPRAQFRKWTFSGNFFRPFKVGEQGFEFSSQWSSQYSHDVLYGSEQMMIGSLYSVRGFNRSSISGDHGFFVRNEVGMRRPFDLAGVTGSVRPWLGLDYGRVYSRNEGVPEGALTGLALGVQFNLRNGINADIQATKPLSKPNFMQFDPFKVWLRLSASI